MTVKWSLHLHSNLLLKTKPSVALIPVDLWCYCWKPNGKSQKVIFNILRLCDLYNLSMPIIYWCVHLFMHILFFYNYVYSTLHTIRIMQQSDPTQTIRHRKSTVMNPIMKYIRFQNHLCTILYRSQCSCRVWTLLDMTLFLQRPLQATFCQAFSFKTTKSSPSQSSFQCVHSPILFQLLCGSILQSNLP